MSEHLIAVYAVGRDRPGALSEVIGALSPLAVYHDDPKTNLLPGGNTFILVAIRTDVGLEQVRAALAPVCAEDFDIRAVELVDHTADESANVERHHFVLRIRSAGRPGVLAEFTKVVARHGGRILDFGTRIGGGRVSVLRVELPTENNDDDVYTSLGRDLYSLAEQIGVGIKFFDTAVGENAEMYGHWAPSAAKRGVLP